MDHNELVALLGDNTEAVEALNLSISSAVNAEKQIGLNNTNTHTMETKRMQGEIDALRGSSAQTQTDNDSTVTALTTRLSEMEERETASLTKSKEVENRLTLSALSSQLGDDFAGTGSLAKEIIADGRAVLNADNTVSLVVDGKSQSWADSVIALKESHADMVKVTQVTGTGTGGGHTKPDGKPMSTLDLMESLSTR